MKCVTLETARNGYAVNQCGSTLTVAELIDLLKDFDEDTPVYFSNDGGYTYGSLYYDSVNCIESE